MDLVELPLHLRLEILSLGVSDDFAELSHLTEVGLLLVQHLLAQRWIAIRLWHLLELLGGYLPLGLHLRYTVEEFF